LRIGALGALGVGPYLFEVLESFFISDLQDQCFF